MKKIVYMLLIVSFFAAGCVKDYDGKISELEGKAKDVESRVTFVEGQLEALEQKTAALEAQQKVAAVKPAESAAVESMTNEEVQTALKNAGFYTGTIDGKMGPETDKAIRDFQSANGLTVDGVIGKNTKSALRLHLSQ